MSILHEHKPSQDCTRNVNPPPRFTNLSVRQLATLLLAAHDRGHTVASLDQIRSEILRRELSGVGDKR